MVSSWNYRIVKYAAAGVYDECYGIVECYYNDAGEVVHYDESPRVVAETIEELLEVLDVMKQATTKPTLVDGDVEFGEP